MLGISRWNAKVRDYFSVHPSHWQQSQANHLRTRQAWNESKLTASQGSLISTKEKKCGNLCRMTSLRGVGGLGEGGLTRTNSMTGQSYPAESAVVICQVHQRNTAGHKATASYMLGSLLMPPSRPAQRKTLNIKQQTVTPPFKWPNKDFQNISKDFVAASG